MNESLLSLSKTPGNLEKKKIKIYIFFGSSILRLASAGILGKEREPGVGKLGWNGNFDAGFERNIYFVQNLVRGFFF